MVRPARANPWRCKSTPKLITANQTKRNCMRVRAIQLKHRNSPSAIYRELNALEALEDVANQVAGNCHRWWRNSEGAINRLLTIAYFNQMGVPRLSWPKASEPPGANSHAGWCGRVASKY